MKVVKLDKADVTQLVRLILESDNKSSEYLINRAKKFGQKLREQTPAENPDQSDPRKTSKQGTPNNELSDTKAELIKQAKTNISQLVNDENVGTIVALFLFILTDDSSVMMIRQIGNRYEDHLDGGGKETDFTSLVTSSLKPLTSQFIKAVVRALQKRTEGKNNSGIYGKPVPPPTEAPAPIREANDQDYYDLKATSAKNQLKEMALRSINQLTNNPDVVQVISMFLLYLTDKQTVSDLKALGSTYGKTLDELIDGNGTNWTENLIKDVRSKFTPLVEKMAEVIDEGLKKLPKGVETNPNEKTQETAQQFKQDKVKIEDMVKQYKFQ